jgi:hypothetical protein
MQTASAEPITSAAGTAARGSLTLPIAASAFSTVFGLAVLVNALPVLLGPATPLFDSPALAFYALTHLVTGLCLLVAGLVGLGGALRKRSDRFLLVAGMLGNGSLAVILVLQTLSLWELRYLE